ncbi:MAG TPA: ABC transporter permease [Aggregatilineales bacterium]|nr:ABC transporter permease [Aggregatilineales bacterium]
MNLFEMLRLAFSSLILNRLRSMLTILGIVIGVAAVVALVSFGQSYQAYVDSQFQGIGANTLFVSSTNPTGPNANLIKPQPLTLGDYQAIADPQQVGGVLVAAPSFNVGGTLSANSQSMSQEITGTTPAYEAAQNYTVASGRFLTDNDVSTSTMVVVLGPATAQKLFPNGLDPLGQPVLINNQIFSVVGVLQSKGGGNGFQDRSAIVPLTTAQDRLGGANARTASGEYRVSEILVKTESVDVIPQVQADITAVLSARHQIKYVGLEDFRTFTPSAILNSLNSVLSLLTLFLGMIAGISLLVGGIGVMNIMLVSVTERTREIGLRKAVGATYSDLLSQFLIESVTLCLIGGLLGVILGAAVAIFGGTLLPTLKLSVSGPAVILAVGVSSAIGIFFGLYPASRAAMLKPIEALRYE